MKFSNGYDKKQVGKKKKNIPPKKREYSIVKILEILGQTNKLAWHKHIFWTRLGKIFKYIQT